MDLTRFTGIHAEYDDPRHAAVLLENSTFSRNVYRQGAVDWVFFDRAVALTCTTAGALYERFTDLEIDYVRGSRPFLERIVDEVLGGLESGREKAIALMDWVCLIPEHYPNVNGDPFHGGSEEEIIRKGSTMCNEQARVLIVLAQIAGIPSRYIGHMTMLDYNDPDSGSGHGVTEMYVDGSWGYFDIRGKYFEKTDGNLASTWDLVQDPGLIDRQSDEVVSHMRKTSSMAATRKYLSPSSVHIVCNYLACDHGSYDYSWTYPSKSSWLEARERARTLRVTKHREILPQPMPRGEWLRVAD